MTGEEVVARAAECIGSRFRPHGRSPESGLDCVGLTAIAIGLESVRADYALRGGGIEALSQELAGAGLMQIDQAAPGDVLVMMAGSGQLHLGIATGAGMIHADARLRRVVERPGEPPWAVVSMWRAGHCRTATAGEEV